MFGLTGARPPRARVPAAWAALLLVAALGVTGRSDHGARPALDRDASEYVRLAVALGERDPDSLDFYAGPGALVSDVRLHPPSLQSIKSSADALVASLARRGIPADQSSRRQRLIGQLRALSARVDLLMGDRPAFDVESRSLFGVAPPPSDDRGLATIRARLDSLIPGRDRLVDRYAAFDRRFIVPPDRLQTTFERALAACRQRTLAHIQLPVDERASVEYVGNKPWSAYSRYTGGGRSVISVNTDFRFTVDRLLQVACHEGYPGHHAANTLLDPAGSPGRLEFTVRPLFSPHTLMAEGSAMYAVEIAFSEDERAELEREQLFPSAGISAQDVGQYVRAARLVYDLQDVQAQIARQYLDGALEFARAASALEEQALMRDTDATLKYINEFRSYVTAYTTGRRAVAAFVDRCAGSSDRDRRWQCFERLLKDDVDPAHFLKAH